MAHQSQIIAESTRKPIINKIKPPHTFKSNYKLTCACCGDTIIRGQLATRCGWGGVTTAGYSRDPMVEDVLDTMPGVWLRGVAFSDGSGDSGMFTGVPFVHATCSDAERLEWGGSGGVFGGERGEHFYYEERKRKIAAATKIQALWRGYATRRGPQVTTVCDGDAAGWVCRELIATSTGKQFCCGDYCDLAQRVDDAYDSYERMWIAEESPRMCLRDWMSEHVTTAHFGAADSSSSSDNDSDSENGDNSPPSFASWHPHTGCGADRCWCGLPRDHTHAPLPAEKLQYEELQEENEDLRAENKAIREEKQRLAALILSKGRNNDLHTGENNGLRRENDELRQQLEQAERTLRRWARRYRLYGLVEYPSSGTHCRGCCCSSDSSSADED